MFPTISITRAWYSVFLCVAVALFLGLANAPAQAHCAGKHTGNHPHCDGAQDFVKGLAAHKRGDYAAPLKEWRPIATKGNVRAQYALRTMYANGQGVAKDDRQAVQWYRKTSDQGYSKARSNLGREGAEEAKAWGVLQPLINGSWKSISASENAALPLYKATVYGFHNWAFISGNCWLPARKNDPRCAKINDLMNRLQRMRPTKDEKTGRYVPYGGGEGPLVLACDYGRSNQGSRKGLLKYVFWYQSVIEDLASYEVVGEVHPFARLGNRAITYCPKNSNDAKKLFRGSRF